MKKLLLLLFVLSVSQLSHAQWTVNGTTSIYTTNNAATLNVGIGTSIPDAKLAVKGVVHAQEVKVDISIPGPDYVFEPSYYLPTLEQLNQYIKANKHLPEVPTACAMEENGVKLGEMNMLLLKKVEELTLYMIDQQKQIQDLKAEVNALQSKAK